MILDSLLKKIPYLNLEGTELSGDGTIAKVAPY